MRNSSVSLQPRTPAPSLHTRSASLGQTAETPRPPQFVIPTIRLTLATPSTHGSPSVEPTPLAPRQGGPRKRLVPKKSKLSLLGGKPKEKAKENLEPGHEQTGRSSSSGRSFDIYVDPTDDPDIGEIIVVRKKKSRGALDEVQWSPAPLGDKTNFNPAPAQPKTEVPKEKEKFVPSIFKSKNDDKEKDKDKWWSIGRSKGLKKKQEHARSLSTPPQIVADPSEKRQRAHSMDAGALLKGMVPSILKDEPEFVPDRPRKRTSTGPSLLMSRSSSSSAAPSSQPMRDRSASGSGSIALRAMRSVRSLARIGSWAQLRNGPDEKENVGPAGVGANANVKDKSKFKIRPAPLSIRSTSSGSNFEAGRPTAKKLYIPSTLGRSSTCAPHMSTVRTASSQSTDSNGSVASYGRVSNVHRASTSTTASHASILSNGSGNSTGTIIAKGTRSKRSSSSSASVHWVDQTETIKDRRLREQESEHHQLDQIDNQKFTDPFRKTSVQMMFPGSPTSTVTPTQSIPPCTIRPILTIQAATPEKEPSEGSPVVPAKPRPRPISDQSPMRTRRQGIVLNDDRTLSALDAATTDLANLINRLDLCATPDATPRSGTPANGNSTAPPFVNTFDPFPATLSAAVAARKFEEATQSKFDTPTPEKKPRARRPLFNMSSISSLRALAQTMTISKGKGATVATSSSPPKRPLLGQSIMAWPTGDEEDEVLDISKEAARTLNLRHQSLPLQSELHHKASMHSIVGPSRFVREATPEPDADASMMSTCSRTFGRTPPVRTGDFINGDYADVEEPPSPTIDARTFRGLPQPQPQPQPYSTRLQQAWQQQQPYQRGMSVPVPSEYCHTWRRPSASTGPDGDIYSRHPRDKEGDIPSELQNILSGSFSEDSEGTISCRQRRRVLTAPLPSPGFPPSDPLPAPTSAPAFARMQLPIFQHPLPSPTSTENGTEIVDSTCSSDSEENDTKQSFDFTGELRSLSRAGVSDRRSFVEQLETAFKSSATFDLGGFGEDLERKLAMSLSPSTSENRVSTTTTTTTVTTTTTQTHMRSYSTGSSRPSSGTISDASASVFVAKRKDVVFERPVKVDMSTVKKQPALLARKSSVGLGSVFMSSEPVAGSSGLQLGAKKSIGQLNMNFKFGGVSADSSTVARSEASMSITASPASSSASFVSSSTASREEAKPRTLADIIPPLNNTASPTPLLFPMVKDDSYVLKALAAAGRSRQDSECSSRSRARQQALARLVGQGHSNCKSDFVQQQLSHARSNSDLSFSGFSSFSEIRRGFEFGPDRAPFYPPVNGSKANMSNSSNDTSNVSSESDVEIGRHCEYLESPFSVDYGNVTRPGMRDPFEYGTSVPIRPPSIDMSMSVDDTFDFIHGRDRKRLDSDASSFYFPTEIGAKRRSIRMKRYRDSILSVTSLGPPISIYNKKRGSMLRNEVSNDLGPVRADTLGVRTAWTMHRNEQFRQSVASDISSRQMNRPGLGDKMFESAHDYGMPLSSITASPSQESEYSDVKRSRFSLDSIMNEGKLSSGDSILNDSPSRLSVASDIFGFGKNFSAAKKNCGLLMPTQYRPVSIFSTGSSKPAPREEDTMISILGGGGYVRRRSLESSCEVSPCMQAEKRIAQQALPSRRLNFNRSVSEQNTSFTSSASKSRFLDDSFHRPSSSEQFGNLRMNLAKQGLLSRNSLEESCLSGEGEDSMTSYSLGVFRPPAPIATSASVAGPSREREASRSRCSSFGTSTATGTDTPPLSMSGGSSVHSGSQYSIDVAQLNALLSDPSEAVMTAAGMATLRARPRPRNRNRLSFQGNRTSVYETIEEESGSPPREKSAFKAPEAGDNSNVKPLEPAVQIVQWDDDLEHQHDEDDTGHGHVLRRFYALRSEAFETLSASKRDWVDTPMSLFALQTFEPPRNPGAMQALLEHSRKHYGPLPSELRSRRTRNRTLSRPSPYPRSRKSSLASNNGDSARLAREMPVLDVPPVPDFVKAATFTAPSATNTNATCVLKDVKVNTNINTKAPTLGVFKLMSPFKLDFPSGSTEDLHKGKSSSALGIPRGKGDGGARSRNNSGASRKSAKSARSVKRRAVGAGGAVKPSMELKENTSVSAGAVGMLSQNDTLRIVRPRPRGRPALNTRNAQPVRA